MSEQPKIAFLHDYPNMILTLKNYFEEEWIDYYGPQGPGDALKDIKSLCNKSEPPIGLIAMNHDSIFGSVALRQDSASHHHLSPWVTSLFVVPNARRKGVGTILVKAIEKLSMDLGYSAIYARSSTAVGFFKKNHWIPFDTIDFRGDQLTVFSKNLSNGKRN